jgi:prepilin-type N-terminal cleavage/methylation domain-containing protein/prepilin-type processing-associated H-X9-DG protein
MRNHCWVNFKKNTNNSQEKRDHKWIKSSNAPLPSLDHLITTLGMRGKGFTLVELLVTIVLIGLLAALLLPALGRAKSVASRSACASNLRQLGVSFFLYGDDSSNQFPPRSKNRAWTDQLKASSGMLLCPAEKKPASSGTGGIKGFSTPSTYILNGFNDLLLEKGGQEEWNEFVKTGTSAFPLTRNSLPWPVDTVLLGEKTLSSPYYYLDLLLESPNFIDVLEEGRHTRKNSSSRSGSSNYVFADGSVRTFPFGTTICPMNLWAVFEESRQSKALCRPH